MAVQTSMNWVLFKGVTGAAILSVQTQTQKIIEGEGRKGMQNGEAYE
jgi:hypothetical protein